MRSGPTVVPMRLQPGVDPLDGFMPEGDAPPPSTPSPASTISNRRPPTALIYAGLAILAVLVLGAATLYVSGRRTAAAGAAASGQAVLNSRPSGAAVLVDGVERGTTPLELALPVGTHEVVFRGSSGDRRLSIVVDSGTRVSENVDLPVAAADAGQLEITSDPTGARVSVDGKAAGVTPLTLRDVAPAHHTIAVSQGSVTMNREVEVSAGATASVFVSLAQPGTGATAGYFAVESPMELRILENGQLLGLSTAAPLMLPSGRHQFELVNDAAEIRIARTVQIDAGKPTRLNLPLPNGSLSMNASPWAEAFLDGRSLGITPLGNLDVPVGRHEIVWRHPQLGEKRSTIVVGARTPARVSMDMSR